MSITARPAGPSILLAAFGFDSSGLPRLAPGHTHIHHPAGLLSDTLVAASMVDLCGIAVLERLPGRRVFFDRDFTELYGDGREWQGMRYRKGAVAIADMILKMRFSKEAENAA